MKIICIGELDPKDVKMMHTRGKEWVQEIKQNPEKYGKQMFLKDGTACNFVMIGKYKVFMLLEAENEQQLLNVATFWQTQAGKYETPLIKNMKLIPIVQG